MINKEELLKGIMDKKGFNGYKTEEEMLCRDIEAKFKRLKTINKNRFYWMCDWVYHEIRTNYSTQRFNKKLHTFCKDIKEVENGNKKKIN